MATILKSLFRSKDLQDQDIRHLLNGVFGRQLFNWAGGKRDENDKISDEIEDISNLDEVAKQKLAELKTYDPAYRDLTLTDMLVVFSYSWRGDRMMREARTRDRSKESAETKDLPFGKWQAFAMQFFKSLRKLRRFTGSKLYRMSLPGPLHEADKHFAEEGRSWTPTSFLSTTYTWEARDGLADGKYRGGTVLEIDASDVEGYHTEDFSLFSGEHEVVVLPRHTLTRTGEPYSTRTTGDQTMRTYKLDISRPDRTLLPAAEADSPAYFVAKRKRESDRVPPPMAATSSASQPPVDLVPRLLTTAGRATARRKQLEEQMNRKG